jgi:DNA-binding response OmpR family regulator
VSMLIADDDEELRISLRSAFEPMGFDIHLAGGGTVAVELARRKAIDIAILDINMPDLNGLEVLRRIRQAHRSTACIFITSEPPRSIAERAASVDSYIIVRKPIRLERLRCAVTELLGTRGGDARRRPGRTPDSGEGHVSHEQEQLSGGIGGKP